jgi:PBP1b-binding outer membrane lipoprotein LpoB
MKRTKLLFIAAMITLSASLIVGCKKEDNSNGNNSNNPPVTATNGSNTNNNSNNPPVTATNGK